MPTIITHGVSAVLLGKSIFKTPVTWRFWFCSAIAAMLPDADVIGFLFGVEYGSFWGHRGFSHSLTFAVMAALIIVLVFKKKLLQIRDHLLFWFVYFSLIIASHGFFDAFTDGGLGVAFFSPFSNKRYFFPWTPMKVSPIGVHGLFSWSGVRLFASEFQVVLLPLLFIYLLSLGFHKFRREKNGK